MGLADAKPCLPVTEQEPLRPSTKSWNTRSGFLFVKIREIRGWKKNAVEKRQSKLSYKFVSQKKKDIPLWVKKYIIAIFLCNPLAIAQNQWYNTYEKMKRLWLQYWWIASMRRIFSLAMTSRWGYWLRLMTVCEKKFLLRPIHNDAYRLSLPPKRNAKRQKTMKANKISQPRTLVVP